MNKREIKPKMKDTAIQEINEKFKNLNSEKFYAWYWNNRERLNKKDKRTPKHEKLKNILIKYGSREYGDAIIDEISLLFKYPPTKF